MKTLKRLFTISLLAIMPLAFAIDAEALPALQLDIVGGTYDNGLTTTVTSDPIFTLQAFLSPDQFNALGDTYYLAVAILPSLEYAPGGYSLGSFSVGGNSINVTSDMSFGIPPLDALFPNLGPHSVYQTYYKEIEFNFSGATTDAYNVQTGAPAGPGEDPQMYFSNFAINMTGLAPGYNLHFDLYNTNLYETLKNNGDSQQSYETKFAPFSKDAQTQVPEPGTLLLLGSGLLGLGLIRRRK